MTDSGGKGNQLRQIRDRIDAVDDSILNLLYRRQELVGEITRWKSDHNMPIYDSQREAEKVASLMAKVPELDQSFVKEIFESILRLSKFAQRKPQCSDLDLTVSVIGMGLMGGSIYKSIQAFHPKVQLKAWDLNPNDQWPMADFNLALKAKIIFLCLPPKGLIKFLKEHSDKIPSSSIVVDISSTKQEISNFINNANHLPFNFIPSHPIVGKSNSGFGESAGNLFIGKKWIICKNKFEVSSQFLELLEGIGAEVRFMPAEDHDYLFAELSHLPHLVSLALLFTAEESIGKKIIPQSFKDLVRISGASGTLWQEIFQSNKYHLGQAVEKFKNKLSALVDSIDTIENDYKKAQNLVKECMSDNSYEKVPHRRTAA